MCRRRDAAIMPLNLFVVAVPLGVQSRFCIHTMDGAGGCWCTQGRVMLVLSVRRGGGGVSSFHVRIGAHPVRVSFRWTMLCVLPGVRRRRPFGLRFRS